MGIPGLLPVLKDFTKTDGHIRDWKGKAIALDTSSWLHKAVYSVADIYVQATEAGTINPHTVRVASRYMIQRCHELLLHAEVSKLYLVLDGQHRCPLKAVTHEERTRRRAIALEQARKAPTKEAAYDKYKACIHISHDFTQAVLKLVKQDALFRNGRIEFVQAPHEADAQLVALGKSGHVQAIITEDSDVLVYAVSAQSNITVLYKLNRQTGACHAISMDWLWHDDSTALASVSNSSNKSKLAQQLVWRTLLTRERSEPGSGRRLFVQACVLAGCDYVPNELPGIAVVKAFQMLVTTHSSHLPAEQRFLSVVRGRLTPRSAAQAYVDKLHQAEAVFYYHPVLLSNGQLAWLTGGIQQPCSPAFPSDNLAILGDPNVLSCLKEPDDNASGTQVDPLNIDDDHDVSDNPPMLHNDTTLGVTGTPNQETGLVTNSLPKVAFDDAFLEIHSLSTQTTTQKEMLGAKPHPTTFSRKPAVNPYRKRPLAAPNGHEEASKRQKCSNRNPFARFALGKENRESNLRHNNLVSKESTIRVGGLQASGPLDASNSEENLEAKDDDLSTEATETSSVESPTAISGSSYFTQGKEKMFARKVSQDSNLSDPQTVATAALEPTLSSTLPSGSLVPAEFYDEWLSPKMCELEDDAIESPDSPSQSTRKSKPIPPQGVALFRLGGLMTTKPTVASKSRPRSKSLLNKSAQQKKLVFQPRHVAGTLLEHFRVSKPAQK